MTLGDLFIAGCNMAFTKELYDKIKPIPFHFLHDGWIAICAPLFGEIGFINKPLIEYRRHGMNTSQFSSDSKLKSDKAVIETNTKKRIIGDIYRKTLPDQWFENHHYYVCNQIFYEKMKDNMTKDYARLVQKSISFRKDLLQVLPSHRTKALMLLFKNFINRNYFLFRGNCKRFIRDVVFILFNENKAFEHDFNKW